MPQTVEFVVSDVGHIGRVMLTRLWLFQAFITGILFLAFTLAAVMSVMENYPDHSIATFILSLSLAVLAGSILFYVLVQRKLGVARKTLNFRLEVGKSILATVLWILLLAFGALAPCSYYSCRDFRFYNVIAAWTSGIVLLLVFYPAAVFTWLDRRYLLDETSEQSGAQPDEESALLPEPFGGREQAQDSETAPLISTEAA